jgi:hypothetical protein
MNLTVRHFQGKEQRKHTQAAELFTERKDLIEI